MISAFIVHSLLVSLFIGLIIFAIFLWMNFKSSNVDTRTYDEDFDAGSLMSRYQVDTADEEPDPYKTLKSYELQEQRQRKKQPEPQAPEAESEPTLETSKEPSLDELIDSALGPPEKTEEK